MGSEWRKLSLREAGISLLDCVHKTPPDAGQGYPYIAIPQMKQGRIDFDADPRLITDADLVEWTRKACPQEYDVLLSRRCNPGETAHVPSGVRFAVGQNLVLLRSDSSGVEPAFLRWLTQGPEWWGQVSKYLNVGAVFDSLRCADIPNFSLTVPPLPEQRAIAHVLGTLDDKIELNRRMNETLEAMAQALFKSWFVDFDPVIDKALAVGNPIPEALGTRAEARKALGGQRKPLPASIAQHFPDRFVFTEGLGWIPEGWEVADLDSITTELRRGISPKYLDEGGVRVINQKCIRNHEINYSLARRHDETKKKIDGRELAVGDVLVNSTGVGTLGRVAQVAKLDEPTIADSHVTVIRAGSGACKPYTFGRMLLALEPSIQAMGEGSTGQTELSRANLKAMRVLVPHLDCQVGIERVLYSNEERASKNTAENRTLAALRDTLLPKLLSGELRVPDAEKQVEKAL